MIWVAVSPVERLLVDPMLPTQLLVLGAGLRLFQNPDDPFFAEPLPLHAEFSLVFLPENSLLTWTVLWGEGQMCTAHNNKIRVGLHCTY